MSLLNNNNRYGGLIVALHWLVLLLIVAAYACVELHEIFPKGSELRQGLRALHFSFGLTVLAITALRLPLALFLPTPRITPVPPRWQTVLAKLMHLALYTFLIAVPLAGWLVLSLQGYRVAYFGWELPALISPNETLAELLDDLHEAGGTSGYALIGAHALAALFHHYVVGDNTLARMLPKRLSHKNQDD